LAGPVLSVCILVLQAKAEKARQDTVKASEKEEEDRLAKQEERAEKKRKEEQVIPCCTPQRNSMWCPSCRSKTGKV